MSTMLKFHKRQVQKSALDCLKAIVSHISQFGVLSWVPRISSLESFDEVEDQQVTSPKLKENNESNTDRQPTLRIVSKNWRVNFNPRHAHNNQRTYANSDDPLLVYFIAHTHI